jgi:hypothetical protein
MDSGDLILFVLLAIGLLAGGYYVAAQFILGSPSRWRRLGLWGVGVLVLAILGRHLNQVYWLDERLFVAASHGDAAQVRALLSAGASPDTQWEDGTSALRAARRGEHMDVVTILESAGAHP